MISSPAAAASSTTYTYTAKKNNQDVIKTGTIDLSASRATIEVSMNEPGMLYVQITREGGSPMTVGAAIEPRKIFRVVPRPADFDQFWADKLAALAGVPIDPVLTPIETNVPGVDTYTVELASLGSHVHGYLVQAEPRGQVSGARDLSVRRRLCAEHEDRDRSGGGRLAGIRRRFARHAARTRQRVWTGTIAASARPAARRCYFSTCICATPARSTSSGRGRTGMAGRLS